MKANHFSPLLAGLIAILAGCDRDNGIVVYRAPKDPPRVVQAADMPSSEESPSAPAQGGRQQIAWTLPSGWKPIPTGQMEYAAFAVSDEQPPVKCTVVPAMGSLLANVNRWEGQLGLPESTGADLSKVVRHQAAGSSGAQLEGNDAGIDFVDLTGPAKPPAGGPQQRMLAAIIPQGDQAWFFKLVGPIQKVSAQQQNFESFVRSVHFAAPVASQGEPDSPAPAQGSAGGNAGDVHYTVPAGWQAEPAKAMRVASFFAGPADAQAEVIVTSFPADNFDLGANISRWRGQVNLSGEVTEQPQKTTLGRHNAVIFDFVGPAADPRPLRQIVLITQTGQNLWFFKIIGPARTVEAQKAAFEAFARSVQFNDGPAR